MAVATAAAPTSKALTEPCIVASFYDENAKCVGQGFRRFQEVTRSHAPEVIPTRVELDPRRILGKQA
jgi:hypothetical protein